MKETDSLIKKINKLILCIVCITQLHSVAWCNPADQQIDAAVLIIKKYGYNRNIEALEGNNYTHKPVKIIFKDLTELDFTYSKHYAVSATDNNGNLYILINDNLKNSDVRLLACLILHESCHMGQGKDSVSEEVQAHAAEEALYRAILLNEDKNLQFQTVDRLVIRENHLKEIVDNSIKAYISGNTTYVNYLKIKE
jgi:hypothetical protein